MIDQLQTILDARTAIRNLGEVVFTQHLLIFKTERAMIGRYHLQMIVLQPVPKLSKIFLLAQRRRKHVLRAFEIWALHFFNREQQVLRTGFREGGQAAITRFTHFVQGVFR